MPNASSFAFFSGRPTIAIGNNDHAALTAGLLAITVIESVTGIYRCEALFGNCGGQNGFLYFDRQTLDFGATFQVKFGQDLLFTGRITALEARYSEGKAPEILILAEDALQDLRMTRRTRSFAEMTDSDVFAQIARDHSLNPQIDLTGPTHKILAQVNQSDLAFLRERARLIDAELWIENTTLHASKRSNRRSQGLELTKGGGLREFTVIADLATQRTSVVATGWDASGKSTLEYEADDSVLGKELGNDESAAGILQQKFRSRKESLAHGAPLSSEETQLQAESLFRHIARRFVVGRGIAETDPALRVGREVDLQGLGVLFSGKYYLAEVRHRWEVSYRLRTEFVGEKPGLGKVQTL